VTGRRVWKWRCVGWWKLWCCHFNIFNAPTLAFLLACLNSQVRLRISKGNGLFLLSHYCMCKRRAGCLCDHVIDNCWFFLSTVSYWLRVWMMGRMRFRPIDLFILSLVALGLLSVGFSSNPPFVKLGKWIR